MISINKPNGDMYAGVDIQDNWLRLHLAALLNYNKGHEDGRKLAVIEVLKSHPAELTDEEI